jgi:dihydroorotate dehydrogenase (NAD+) catalytic subunit
MLNAVGYSNPGVAEAAREFSDMNDIGVPVIASVIGTTVDDFLRVIEGFGGLLAAKINRPQIANNQSSATNHKGFDAVEIPLSCPHTPGFGTLAGQSSPEATFRIVSGVRKKVSLPLFVKLSPNVPDIGNLAKIAEDAGADAITAVNTMGPGMVINIEARRPVLDFKVGGVSGPALRPIAVKSVFDIYELVKIPIIGVGGISTGRHAIEMIMAGAAAIGIGTAIYNRGIDVFKKVCDEIKIWMSEHGFNSISELTGAAHE